MARCDPAYSFVLALTCACLAFSGCQEVQPPAEPSEPVAAPADPACDLETYRELIGMTEAMLEFVHLPEEHRVLRTDTVATTDYVPTRLNISISEDRTVTRVACG